MWWVYRKRVRRRRREEEKVKFEVKEDLWP